MVSICFQINVLNGKEYVANKKKEAKGWFSYGMLNDQQSQKKIEEVIKEKMVKQIGDMLNKEFMQEGIAADVRVTVKHDETT